ncbi:MAG: DUF1311 domain-containing protein [Afipia sp.]|nr:DUF1311 domain-containing protein [Afipia sp.]
MKSSLVIFAVVFLSATAEAQTPKAKASVESCLAMSKAKPNTDLCIGVTSNPCIGRDEGAKRDSEVAACLDDEQRQWDKVLNASFQSLLKGLEPEQQTKLREMQRLWLQSRAATCQFYFDYFDGTMANPMIANCMNRETARRAIFLKGFADDLAQRK